MLMKQKLLKTVFALSAALLMLAACSDDGPETPAVTVTEYDSTTIPALIPAEGGCYLLKFKMHTETRSAEPLFEPWQFRLTQGDAVGDAVSVTSPQEEIEVTVGANHSKEERTVRVEMKTLQSEAWTAIVEARQEPALHDYLVTAFKSSDLPETVPFNGGDYTLTFETAVETRAANPIFVEWQYRLTVDGTAGEPVAVTEPTESVALHVEPNYTENARALTVEMAEGPAENPVWKELAKAQQEPALMLVAGFYWAKGNVTLRNGRFALADKMSDTGLYFRHESLHGVKSDEASYSGTAYTPAPVRIALSDIPVNQAGADPCTLISENLRTPTYMELWYLIDAEDYKTYHSLDGVDGMGYLDSPFFMPYAGAMNIPASSVTGKGQFGGYWGLGGDYEGNGTIYTLNKEYSLVDYDLMGENMATLRCVKNLRQPSYVSHTPATVDTNGSFKIEITTDPGEFSFYEVALWSSEGDYTKTSALDTKRQVSLIVPKNETKNDVEWRIFINNIYTGASIIQPGMKNYAVYVSHTPAKSSYEAFTASVICDSDMESFPVVLKGSDGTELSAAGSKDAPSVEFQIGENSGTERTFAIIVNGVDTKRTIVQEAKPKVDGYSVEWSEGYLTIVDGRYTFAAPQERGMYFKWKSRYGILIEGTVTGSSKYAGVCYAPERMEIADYADLPHSETDPCSLVAPAGTWYMPDAELLAELTADGAKDWESGVYRMCSDGKQQVYLAPSGQMNKTTSKVSLPGIVSVWASTPSQTKPENRRYLMWSTTSASGKPSVSTGGVDPNTAMMVRCVRNR